MKTIEEVYCDVLRDPKSIKNVLVGFALGLIPIVNFLSFNYLEQFGRQRKGKNVMTVPGWFPATGRTGKKILREFWDGAWVFLEFLLTVGVAIAVCYVIFGLIGRKELGLCLGLFASAPVFACAMVSGISAGGKNVPHMLRGIIDACRLVFANYKKLIIPSILFLCLQIIAFLIFSSFFMGGPLFLGFVFLIAQAKQILSCDSQE